MFTLNVIDLFCGSAPLAPTTSVPWIPVCGVTDPENVTLTLANPATTPVVVAVNVAPVPEIVLLSEIPGSTPESVMVITFVLVSRTCRTSHELDGFTQQLWPAGSPPGGTLTDPAYGPVTSGGAGVVAVGAGGVVLVASVGDGVVDGVVLAGVPVEPPGVVVAPPPDPPSGWVGG